MAKENFKKAIVKSILNNSLTATAWTFSFLAETSVLSTEAFFRPSVYADLPNLNWRWLGGDADSIKKYGGKKPKYKEITVRQSLRRLQKHGFIEKRGTKYAITAKGRDLARYILNMKKVFDKKWDKKYRVIIFDIPERQNNIRSWLREELKFLGYKKLQQSVFIGKYPLPPDLIKEIKRYKIGSYVNYILADKVYKNVW